MREGDTVQVGELGPQVWETPGHCGDHVCYWFEEAGARLRRRHAVHPRLRPHHRFDPGVDLWHSLQRLAALPAETRVYSGHDYVLSNAKFALAADPDNAGELKARAAEAEKAKAEGRFLVPSTIGEEKATNPFLRSGLPSLAQIGRSCRRKATPEAVFVALRAWKNRF